MKWKRECLDSGLYALQKEDNHLKSNPMNLHQTVLIFLILRLNNPLLSIENLEHVHKNLLKRLVRSLVYLPSLSMEESLDGPSPCSHPREEFSNTSCSLLTPTSASIPPQR